MLPAGSTGSCWVLTKFLLSSSLGRLLSIHQAPPRPAQVPSTTSTLGSTIFKMTPRQRLRARATSSYDSILLLEGGPDRSRVTAPSLASADMTISRHASTGSTVCPLTSPCTKATVVTFCTSLLRRKSASSWQTPYSLVALGWLVPCPGLKSKTMVRMVRSLRSRARRGVALVLLI